MVDHAPYVPPVYSKRGQLGRDAAVRYQDVAVPWIFGPFGEALVQQVEARRGEAALDVGCGTGAATRPAAVAVGPAGRVVGLDLNVGMLEVARGLDASAEHGPDAEGDGAEAAAIEWIEASAEALPLANRSFDVVIASQAVQFPADTTAVAGEIRRVLRPGGRLGLTAWRAPSASPYFAAEIEAVATRLGPEAADGLIAGFGLADPAPLVTALAVAGVSEIETRRIDLILDLPPIADWAPRHLAATPVATGLASAPGMARELGADIAQAMAEYITPDGVRVPFSSWFIAGVAPAV
jgi:SAM-dependent methyltransferase